MHWHCSLSLSLSLSFFLSFCPRQGISKQRRRGGLISNSVPTSAGMPEVLDLVRWGEREENKVRVGSIASEAGRAGRQAGRPAGINLKMKSLEELSTKVEKLERGETETLSNEFPGYFKSVSPTFLEPCVLHQVSCCVVYLHVPCSYVV